jgi:hypothetical protein
MNPNCDKRLPDNNTGESSTQKLEEPCQPLEEDDNIDFKQFGNGTNDFMALQHPVDEKGEPVGAYPISGWDPKWCPATMGGQCVSQNGKCKKCERALG